MDLLAKMRRQLKLFGGRKDIWLWIAKYGAVFALFLTAFLPLYGQLSSASSGVASLRSQLEDMRKVGPGLMGPEETQTLRERAAAFEAGLTPSRGSKLVDRISVEAEKHNFEIIQIYSDAPVPLKDAQGDDVGTDGVKLSLLPVNFRVQTDAKNFAEFLRALSAESAGPFVVESLHLQKPSPESPTLQCDVTLSYIVR